MEKEQRKLFAIVGVDKNGIEYTLQQAYEDYVTKTLNDIRDELNANTWIRCYGHNCLIRSETLDSVVLKEIND